MIGPAILLTLATLQPVPAQKAAERQARVAATASVTIIDAHIIDVRSMRLGKKPSDSIQITERKGYTQVDFY
jgi:hypothetical protein